MLFLIEFYEHSHTDTRVSAFPACPTLVRGGFPSTPDASESIYYRLSAGISPSKAQQSNDLNLNVGVVSAMHPRGPPDCPLGVACAHENQLQVGLPGRRL